MASGLLLPSPTETGELGIFQLRRVWARALAARRGKCPVNLPEQRLNHIVTDAVCVGLEQVQQYLMQRAPTFEEFERWIVDTTGGVEPDQVARINAAVMGQPAPESAQRRLAAIDAMPPVLTATDFAHWDEHGYVIVHDAVPEDTRRAAQQALWEHLGARPDDPDSWYVPNSHGIMVQLFQHPAFTTNRLSPRIHKAFAQLWGDSRPVDDH